MLPPPRPVMPSLQTLVEHCGGYDKITPEAWAWYEREKRLYLQWHRWTARFG